MAFISLLWNKKSPMEKHYNNFILEFDIRLFNFNKILTKTRNFIKDKYTIYIILYYIHLYILFIT